MKNKIYLVIISTFILVAALADAYDFDPARNITLQDLYSIKNGVISNFTYYYGDGSGLTDINGSEITNVEGKNVIDPPAAPAVGYCISHFNTNFGSATVDYFPFNGANYLESIDMQGFTLSNGTISPEYIHGGTWTTSQDMNGETLSNGTISATNLSDGTMQCIDGDCTGMDDTNSSEFYGNGYKMTNAYDEVICRTTDTGCTIVCTDSNCTDDVQAVADGGNVVIYMRPGTYPWGGTLYLESNTILKGAGNATILVLEDNIDETMIMNKNQVAGVVTDHDITIETLTLDGNGLQQTAGKGIKIINAERINILNNIIKDTRSYNIGYARMGSGFVCVTGSKIIGNTLLRELSGLPLADSVAVECEDCRISDNYIYNINGAGITTAEMKDTIIGDNILNVSNVAINLESPSNQTNVIISGNILRSRTTLGFSLNARTDSKTENIQFKDNEVYYSSYGVFIDPHQGNITLTQIKDNTFCTDSGAETIYITGGFSDSSISGNIFNLPYDEDHVIICMNGSSDIVIEDNIASSGGSFLNLVSLNSTDITIKNNKIGRLKYTFMYPGTGIYLRNSEIIGNTIKNTGWGADGSYDDGLQLIRVVDSLISNNHIFDDQDTKTMQYGLHVQSGSVNNTIYGNHIHNVALDLVKVDVTGNYVDVAEYTAMPTCATNSIFQGKYITNSSDYHCRCDGGTWKCLGPFV